MQLIQQLMTEVGKRGACEVMRLERLGDTSAGASILND